MFCLQNTPLTFSAHRPLHSKESILRKSVDDTSIRQRAFLYSGTSTVAMRRQRTAQRPQQCHHRRTTMMWLATRQSDYTSFFSFASHGRNSARTLSLACSSSLYIPFSTLLRDSTETNAFRKQNVWSHLGAQNITKCDKFALQTSI